MSIAEQDPHILDESPSEVDGLVGGSILDRLRARREQVARETVRELELVIPGYEGLLGVRYRYPWADSDRVIALAQRLSVSLLSDDVPAKHDDAVELVTKCCHELIARESPDGMWVPLDPAPDETQPLRFGNRLAELLRISLPEASQDGRRRSSAKFVARHVFSPAAQHTGVYEGDPAISQHGIAVAGWLQKSDAVVDEALVGE